MQRSGHQCQEIQAEENHVQGKRKAGGIWGSALTLSKPCSQPQQKGLLAKRLPQHTGQGQKELLEILLAWLGSKEWSQAQVHPAGLL